MSQQCKHKILTSGETELLFKMYLKLNGYDQALLGGEYGPAAKMAMSIMLRMAEVYQAKQLMDISAAHIDSTLYMGDATLEYAERLANMGAKVVVPTSLNVSGVDEHHLPPCLFSPIGRHRPLVPMVFVNTAHI